MLSSPATVAAGAVPRLVFPLVAKTVLWDNYGDPRGMDVMPASTWRTRGGTRRRRRGRDSQVLGPGVGGCMLYHYGRSGTTYLYIHLNNDLTPRNDDKGGCVKGFTLAVPDGAKVTGGQQIGWNGVSGDASGNPHLHFEVHPSGGGDVNLFRHLRRASKPLFAARKGTVFSLGLRGNSSPPERVPRRSRSPEFASTPVDAGSTSSRASSSSPSLADRRRAVTRSARERNARALKTPIAVSASR